jgi:hypothetical protein
MDNTIGELRHINLTFNCDVHLSFAVLYEVCDAAVVGFFAVLGEEASRYLAGLAVISHALATQPALGTVVRAGAIFHVRFFHAFHRFELQYNNSRVLFFNADSRAIPK